MESGARRSLTPLRARGGGVAVVRRGALSRPSHCSHGASHCSHGAGFFFSRERR